MILLGFVLTGISTLTRGHVWLDDFAGYVMQAKSIINGDMADFISHNSFTINNSAYPPGPIAYPWGFPLLLVPVYVFFGNNPIAFKLVNIAAYTLFLIFTYLLSKTRLKGTDSLILTAVFAFLPVMLKANDYIISDLPFLAASMLAVYIIDQLKTNVIYLLFTGLSIFLAFFIRVNGILLFVPLIILIIFEKKLTWKNKISFGIIPFLSFLIIFLIQIVIFPGGQSSYFTHFSLLSINGIFQNIVYYLLLPFHLFDELPLPYFLWLFVCVFFGIGLYLRFRKNIALITYSFSTILLFIFWPERQGLRFIYPVLPIILILSFEGLQLVSENIKNKWNKYISWGFGSVWFAVITIALFISSSNAYNNLLNGRVINGPYDSYSREMFEFISEKTPADSVYIFMRPRAFRLFTGRDSFMSDQCSGLVKGDFVILHQKMTDMGQIDPQKVAACDKTIKLDEVFSSKRFVVYHILH
ncbi:MAG: hypothetical protein WCP19_02315 [Chloroflexota bacterium]